MIYKLHHTNANNCFIYLLLFYGRNHNLCDYLTYKITTYVFFALNKKIGRIL